jgi:hypothetical protein
LVTEDGLAIDLRHYFAIRGAFPLARGEGRQACKLHEDYQRCGAAQERLVCHASIVTPSSNKEVGKVGAALVE